MGNSAPQLYSLYDEDIRTLVNTHVGTANYLMRPVESVQQLPDTTFLTNEEVWQALLPPREQLRANLNAQLDGFLLFEWLPHSPGLFHTYEGRQARADAEFCRRQLPVPRVLPAHLLRHDDPDHEFLEIFDPYGKLSMLKGGIGCIRLRSTHRDSEDIWLMSASSSGIAHEGFPVAIPDHIYQKYIDTIKTDGALRCTLKGKLRFLPSALVELYRGYKGVPQLYLLAEDLIPSQTRDPQPLLVTVGVSFLSSFEGQNKVYASYATFDPSVRDSVSETAEWLEEVYVKGLYSGSVVTDFDEQMARFSDAAFSLKGVMQNELSKTAVQTFVNTVNVYGGDTTHLFTSLQTIQNVHIERLEKMEQSGGVSITAGRDVKVGGDIVGGNKISLADLNDILKPVTESIKNAPAEMQEQATQKIDELKNEAAKGTSANDGVMAKLIEGIVGLVPKAVGAIASAFGTPILGAIAGPATKEILDKIQGK